MISSSSDWLTEDEGARGELAVLAHDLANPPMQVGVRELASMWTWEALRFTCARPHDFEDYPDLPERLRGAFGQALHRQPAPRMRSGMVRPHARDVLFAPLGRGAGGDEHPKPFVIRTWVEGGRLMVELRLFGWAIGWQAEAASAMLDALQQGIALRTARRAMRCMIEVRDFERSRQAAVDVPVASGMRLRFRSPVALRQRGAVHADPAAVVAAALPRVRAMAAWQGCRLVEPDAAWREAVSAARPEALDWRVVRWQRFSRNMGHVAIPMMGHMGVLGLAGDVVALAPILAMAETCHLGSHAALGMGWFEVIAG